MFSHSGFGGPISGDEPYEFPTERRNLWWVNIGNDSSTTLIPARLCKLGQCSGSLSRTEVSRALRGADISMCWAVLRVQEDDKSGFICELKRLLPLSHPQVGLHEDEVLVPMRVSSNSSLAITQEDVKHAEMERDKRLKARCPGKVVVHPWSSMAWCCVLQDPASSSSSSSSISSTAPFALYGVAESMTLDVRTPGMPVCPRLNSLYRQLRAVNRQPMHFGYLTMDRSRKVVPLLEQDPLALQRPLVGVWVDHYNQTLPSGGDSAIIGSLDTTLLWNACMRFLHNAHIKERAFRQDLDGSQTSEFLVMGVFPPNPTLGYDHDDFSTERVSKVFNASFSTPEEALVLSALSDVRFGGEIMEVQSARKLSQCWVELAARPSVMSASSHHESSYRETAASLPQLEKFRQETDEVAPLTRDVDRRDEIPDSIWQDVSSSPSPDKDFGFASTFSTNIERPSEVLRSQSMRASIPRSLFSDSRSTALPSRLPNVPSSNIEPRTGSRIQLRSEKENQPTQSNNVPSHRPPMKTPYFGSSGSGGQTATRHVPRRDFLLRASEEEMEMPRAAPTPSPPPVDSPLRRINNNFQRTSISMPKHFPTATATTSPRVQQVRPQVSDSVKVTTFSMHQFQPVSARRSIQATSSSTPRQMLASWQKPSPSKAAPPPRVQVVPSISEGRELFRTPPPPSPREAQLEERMQNQQRELEKMKQKIEELTARTSPKIDLTHSLSQSRSITGQSMTSHPWVGSPSGDLVQVGSPLKPPINTHLSNSLSNNMRLSFTNNPLGSHMTPDRRQVEVQKLEAQQLEKQFDVVGSSSAQVLVKDALPQPLLLQAQYADVSVKMVNPVESKPIASLQNTILSSNPQQSHGKPKALVPSLDLDKLNTSHTSVSQTPSAIHDADGGCNSKITYALSARNIPPPQSPSPALSSPPPLPTAAPVELASAAVPALQQPRTPARPPSSHSSPPPVVVNTISPNASLEKSATKSSGKKPSMRASSSLSDDEGTSHDIAKIFTFIFVYTRAYFYC